MQIESIKEAAAKRLFQGLHIRGATAFHDRTKQQCLQLQLALGVAGRAVHPALQAPT
jgi:hypothetical protein